MWFFDKKRKNKTKIVKDENIKEQKVAEETVVADEFELEQSVNEEEEERTKELVTETISTKDLSVEEILAHLDEGDTQEFDSKIVTSNDLEFDITKTIEDEKKLINLIEGINSEVDGDEDFITSEEPIVVDPFEKYGSRVKKIVRESKNR